MGPAWCGVEKLPLEKQKEARMVLRWANKEFQEFLKRMIRQEL